MIMDDDEEMAAAHLAAAGEDEEFPDIHALYRHYNDLYFGGLLGACSVEWSTSRMTL